MSSLKVINCNCQFDSAGRNRITDGPSHFIRQSGIWSMRKRRLAQRAVLPPSRLMSTSKFARDVQSIYLEQVFDPSRWGIIYFHDHTSHKLNNYTMANNANSLLPMGNNIQPSQCHRSTRKENISFIQVKVPMDLSSITRQSMSKYALEMFIVLRRSNKPIKDGKVNNAVKY